MAQNPQPSSKKLAKSASVSAANSPLLSQDFAAVMAQLGPFESRPALAVAVSGGADSLALCLLAHEWASANGGSITALTVDHGLRPESAQEAKQVALWLRARGITHHVLAIAPIIGSGNMQARARTARYEALEAWCRKHHVLHLLTAHHIDDQAETLLIRLGRGSGVDGLAAMPAVSERRFVRHLRPLLVFPKAALIASCERFGQKWVEDPSNTLQRFTRSQWRAAMPMLEALGANQQRLANTAASLARARAALEVQHAAAAVECVTLNRYGEAIVASDRLINYPADTALRLLAATLSVVSGEPLKPRLEKLERLYARILSDKLNTRLSLRGCLITPQDDSAFTITREPKAICAPMLIAGTGEIHWDRRFRLSYDIAPTLPHLTLAPLGKAGLAQLAENGVSKPDSISTAAALALPALWHLETLALAPHMAYHTPEAARISVSAHFQPTKPLAGPPFFVKVMHAKKGA